MPPIGAPTLPQAAAYASLMLTVPACTAAASRRPRATSRVQIARVQAVVALVRQPHRLVVAADPVDRDDRPERLLGVAGHRRRSRPRARSARRSSGPRSGRCRPPASTRAPRRRRRPRAGHRAPAAAAEMSEPTSTLKSIAGAEPQRPRPAHEAVQERVRDLLVQHHPLDRDAELPGAGEAGADGALGGAGRGRRPAATYIAFLPPSSRLAPTSRLAGLLGDEPSGARSTR